MDINFVIMPGPGAALMPDGHCAHTNRRPKIFDQIATGHTKDLEQVFGKANVAAARAKVDVQVAPAPLAPDAWTQPF